MSDEDYEEKADPEVIKQRVAFDKDPRVGIIAKEMMEEMRGIRESGKLEMFFQGMFESDDGLPATRIAHCGIGDEVVKKHRDKLVEIIDAEFPRLKDDVGSRGFRFSNAEGHLEVYTMDDVIELEDLS
jgi:hypothetical protein